MDDIARKDYELGIRKCQISNEVQLLIDLTLEITEDCY